MGLRSLLFPGGLAEDRLLLDIAAVAVCIGSSALLYGAALQLLKLPEMNLLVKRLLRRGEPASVA
jgi:hypothetical protein